MQYLITIDLPEEAQIKFKKFTKLLDDIGKRPKIKAHITLVQPSEAKKELLDAKKFFENMRLGSNAFIIICDKISYFENKKDYILYLEAKPVADLKRLRSQVKKKTTRILQYKKGFKRFIPHITIAKRINKKDFKQSIPKLDKQKLNLEFLCKQINLYKMDRLDKNWVYVTEKKL